MKSATRALAVFQLFERLRRRATAKEIGASLGMPASSTSMLLRTLLSLGYLSFEPASRTYLPTLRVVALGNWMLEREADGIGALMALTSHLHRRTGQLVAIGARHGIFARYVHVIPPASPASYEVCNGALYPLSRSTCGWALLARCCDDEVLRVVSCSNAELNLPPVEPRWILGQLDRVRRAGYAFSFGQVRPGAGALSIRLPDDAPAGGVALVIGGNGDEFVQKENHYLQVMREGIAHYLQAGAPPAAPAS